MYQQNIIIHHNFCEYIFHTIQSSEEYLQQ